MHTTKRFYEISRKLLLLLGLSAFFQAELTARGCGASGLASAAPTDEVTLTATATAPMRKRMPPPRVKLNKCCHYGEYLDEMQACIVGSSENWVPLIYHYKNKNYFGPKGEHPKYMSFEENSKPIGAQIIESTTNDSSSVQQSCNNLEELELFTGSGNFAILGNGSLFLRERVQLVDPRLYCVDRDAALVCFPRDKSTLPRIKLRKCCGKYSSYDAATKKCMLLAVTDTLLQLPLNESVYQTFYGFPVCHEASTAYAIVGDWAQAKLQPETGFLQLPHKNLSTADYCLEHLREGNASKAIKIFTCLHHIVTVGPANVLDPNDISSDQLQVAVLNFGLVISAVFLAATLIAGYMMPSVHHVLHWRCQIYYVFSLFVGETLLAYSQLSKSLEIGSTTCVALGSVMHFFFLSAFFWLNTMCVNIWWTFRDFRPSSLERNQEMLRLRLYSAYAWGIPLLFAVIGASIDQLKDTQLLRPEFGLRSCWFSGEHVAIFAYFYGPVGILLCANILLFISTTHQLTCGLWKRDDVKTTSEKTALGKVCLKLVVVMGVTWIVDVVSWLVGGPHSVWFFTDLINALQGVFIFIVVGCQPQVWSACKRLCCPRSRQEITNTTNGVQHSSSSQGLPSMAACGGEITQNTSVNVTTTGGNKTTPAKIPMETRC